MTLGDLLLSVSVQQLVQAELVHAVEVTEPPRRNVRNSNAGGNEKMSGLLVTAVPLPGVAGFTGQKVSGSLVLHPLGEPQQNPGVIIRRVSGGAGERRGGNKSAYIWEITTSTPTLALLLGKEI